MSEQKASTEALRGLVENMQSLSDYCDALRQGASTFAYMLPNEWQGPSMAAFVASFEQWSAGASGLTVEAGALRDQAQVALDAYEQTIDALTDSWSQFESGLSA
ncbi:WXG100 family type VII secretion target [Frigoribacterium sp. 2-23]|uniref:WXG100 family type VII secretion target n=1 Tax=Frigoribacterium sp. 2-23 TaxID=3415006 RepID=UPI003C701A86